MFASVAAVEARVREAIRLEGRRWYRLLLLGEIDELLDGARQRSLLGDLTDCAELAAVAHALQALEHACEAARARLANESTEEEN